MAVFGQVVTEVAALEGDVVGVNMLGLSGSYGHVILRRAPQKSAHSPRDPLPRLLVLSGRDASRLRAVFDQVTPSLATLHHLPLTLPRRNRVTDRNNPIRKIILPNFHNTLERTSFGENLESLKWSRF